MYTRDAHGRIGLCAFWLHFEGATVFVRHYKNSSPNFARANNLNSLRYEYGTRPSLLLPLICRVCVQYSHCRLIRRLWPEDPFLDSCRGLRAGRFEPRGFSLNRVFCIIFTYGVIPDLVFGITKSCCGETAPFRPKCQAI